MKSMTRVVADSDEPYSKLYGLEPNKPARSMQKILRAGLLDARGPPVIHGGQQRENYLFVGSLRRLASLMYVSMASRYFGSRPRVSSTIALARSFSGRVPQLSANSLTFLGSTMPSF